MCGVIAFVSDSAQASALAMEALARLEYRGYDSAGLARAGADGLERRRAAGKLDNLRAALAAAPFDASAGAAVWLGHTRWATHGPPTEGNAHPHVVDDVAVVHNGVIDNFLPLRRALEAEGARFASDADTETAAHLVAARVRAGATAQDATQAAAGRMEGAFAMAFAFAGSAPRLTAIQRGAPLALGRGGAGAWLASDAVAFAQNAREVAYLEDGDMAWLDDDGAWRVVDAEGRDVRRPWATIEPSLTMTGKGRWRHYMAREIHEQPQTLARALAAGLDFTRETATLGDARLAATRRLRLLGCGSAALAADVGAQWLEGVALVPARAEAASEFRYRAPAPEDGATAVGVSQSGETADTLAALRLARARGTPTAAVVNMENSTMAREADWLLPTRAGVEAAVAATKTFTAQLATLAALTLRIGRASGALDEEAERARVRELAALPAALARTLAECAAPLRRLARRLARARDVMFIGRTTSAAIAREGALKMKEVAYVHAEGFAAGELKHGPLALVDEATPVVAFAGPDPALAAKLAANVREAAARGAPTAIVGAREALEHVGDVCEHAIELPACGAMGGPFVQAVAAQLLAYYAGVARGADVDQPRNLAKSVTVE